ncbi:MAG: hypothetical protein E6I59_18715 [Chloroflexi bacterium]|nr:MAG: hypothetical protein E6I59_18715 [Chloroflexota bacterium]
MLAFRCGAGDEVGGHLRLLNGISFLFYFFVWDEKGAVGATGRSSAYVCALRARNQPRNPDGTLAPGRVITKHCDKALSSAIYTCSSRQLLLTEQNVELCGSQCHNEGG